MISYTEVGGGGVTLSTTVIVEGSCESYSENDCVK